MVTIGIWRRKAWKSCTERRERRLNCGEGTRKIRYQYVQTDRPTSTTLSAERDAGKRKGGDDEKKSTFASLSASFPRRLAERKTRGCTVPVCVTRCKFAILGHHISRRGWGTQWLLCTHYYPVCEQYDRRAILDGSDTGARERFFSPGRQATSTPGSTLLCCIRHFLSFPSP